LILCRPWCRLQTSRRVGDRGEAIKDRAIETAPLWKPVL
jgi:hypothetical protein